MPPGRVLASLALLAACSPTPEPPRVLRLVRVHNDPRGVFLNERLVFHFSDDLDQVSVHAGSVRVLDPEGRPAAGELEVEARRVHFLPAPVTRADLSDGGLRPATDYDVVLAGFPHPDGLRSRGGAPLDRTWRWHFRTVDPADPATGFLFEDATPGFAHPISLVRWRLAPGEPISFAGDEPIDPSSLFAEDFELRPAEMRGSTPVLDANGDPVLGEPVPLSARLVDNRSSAGGGSMRFDLQPLARLEPGHYRLRVDQFGTRDPADPSTVLQPGLRLRDFGGNKVWIADLGPSQVATIVVSPGVAPRPTGRHREEFLDTDLRSGQAVAGADGTALWSDLGRVALRYPRAAGDGRDGPVVLDGAVTTTDLAATRLVVPAGARARIEAGDETVVLRSQGRLEVAGRLERQAPGEPIRLAGAPRRLSDWLADARAERRGWTVLVAGGDLVVSGEVRVPGGLLLVAGGRIRVSGTVHDWRDRPDLDPWRLGDGGGTTMQDAAPFLAIDPPAVNPLVEPLTFAVLSGPIPPEGGVARWVGAHVGARQGAGRARVRYVGSGATTVHLAGSEPVLHPGLLGAEPYLRLLVELELPAADATPRWDPPSVDFVEVTWDRVRPEGER